MAASATPARKGRSSRSKGSAAAAAKKPKHPPLSAEHLKFSQMVLKAGLACTLHDAEESESTAQCVERVASDLMGLAAAVATALRRELKGAAPTEGEASDELVRQWCVFYADELLPETKRFCKKVTGRLDAYDLYLPSRIKDGLSPELLEKGRTLGLGSSGGEGEESAAEGGEGAAAADDEAPAGKEGERSDNIEGKDAADGADSAVESAETSATAAASAPGEDEEYDEYEYDEYEEYD